MRAQQTRNLTSRSCLDKVLETCSLSLHVQEDGDFASSHLKARKEITLNAQHVVDSRPPPLLQRPSRKGTQQPRWQYCSAQSGTKPS